MLHKDIQNLQKEHARKLTLCQKKERNVTQNSQKSDIFTKISVHFSVACHLIKNNCV